MNFPDVLSPKNISERTRRLSSTVGELALHQLSRVAGEIWARQPEQTAPTEQKAAPLRIGRPETTPCTKAEDVRQAIDGLLAKLIK